MSYSDFSRRMHSVAHQAALSQATSTAAYQRLVEILEAHPDDAMGAERALWAEYDQTQNVFFQRKAWDIQRER